MTRRYSKLPSNRQLQVGQEIRGILAGYFARKEYYHPLLESTLITITEVRISPDLKIATAFILLPNESDKKSILSVLKDISPVVRKMLAANLKLRYIPEIRFILDETQENVNKVEELLSQLHKN